MHINLIRELILGKQVNIWQTYGQLLITKDQLQVFN